MNTNSIISKVWSFCTTLRDDGVGYGDYLEQLTYLSFSRWRMNIPSRPTTGMWAFPMNLIGNHYAPNGVQS